MINKTVPFSILQSQQRWKVEFFCADASGSKCTTYSLVTLGQILNERGESLDPQAYADHLFNYLGLEHVESLTGDLIPEYRPRFGREVLSRSKVFREGDLLYGRLRPSLNKVFVADQLLNEGICSGEFYVLTPERSKLLPHFARTLLASRYVQDVVRGMTTGSALPRLQLSDLLGIEIPLPPLEIQAKFESHLMRSKAERIRLRSKLDRTPSAEIESLITAIENGTAPTFEDVELDEKKDFSDYKLPVTAMASKKRGRPRTIQGNGLFAEAT